MTHQLYVTVAVSASILRDRRKSWEPEPVGGTYIAALDRIAEDLAAMFSSFCSDFHREVWLDVVHNRQQVTALRVMLPSRRKRV